MANHNLTKIWWEESNQSYKWALIQQMVWNDLGPPQVNPSIWRFFMAMRERCGSSRRKDQSQASLVPLWVFASTFHFIPHDFLSKVWWIINVINVLFQRINMIFLKPKKAPQMSVVWGAAYQGDLERVKDLLDRSSPHFLETWCVSNIFLTARFCHKTILKT